jgi:hypothetical protein
MIAPVAPFSTRREVVVVTWWAASAENEKMRM